VGPRGRKEYRVTEAGHADLLRWMNDPSDDPPYRSTELLRVFLLGEMPPGQARAHMVAVAEQATAELNRYQQLRDAIDWDDSDGDFYGRAALEYGLRAQAMEAEWARWLVKQIDKRSSH
jgi:DNA-binding PadR family transcriptional regulator